MPCRWSLALIPEIYNYVLQVQLYVITFILCAVYTLIGLLVVRLNREVSQIEPTQPTTTDGHNTGKQMKKERKTIKVMAMVLGVFLICYLPTGIYHLIMKTKAQTLAVVLVSR